jgi:hypothetical protein
MIPQSTLVPVNRDGIFALFKGHGGVGKTVAAISFPNCYVFDFDKKVEEIAQKHFPEKNIAFNTFRNIIELFDRLRELERDCPYETLILDSFTKFGSFIMQSEEWAGSKTKKPAAINTDPALEPITFEHYKMETKYTESLADRLRSLYVQPGNPKHIIIIGHTLEYEGAIDTSGQGNTKFKSMVSQGRKVAVTLPLSFNDEYIFGLVRKRGGIESGSVPEYDRVCYTQPYGGEIARCTKNFPPVIHFTNGSLYDKMFPQVRVINEGIRAFQ